MRWLAQPTLSTAASLLVVAGWYATQIEPFWLRVQRLTLTLPQLPPAFNGYRIVHFSDQHLGVRGADRMLARAVQLVNRADPDLIAMTGDLITFSRREYIQPGDVLPLADLHAPDGIWAVPGNHDCAEIAFVEDVLTHSGGTLLRNRAQIIQRGGDRIALVGLDSLTRGRPDLPTALTDVSPGVPIILLVHEPDFAPAAAAYPAIMLQLSGHTHGGQIVPLPGRPLLLPRYGRTHFRGLTRLRHMLLYVTAGTGTGRFAVRWNCRPEIAVITLRCAHSAQPVV